MQNNIRSKDFGIGTTILLHQNYLKIRNPSGFLGAPGELRSCELSRERSASSSLKKDGQGPGQSTADIYLCVT